MSEKALADLDAAEIEALRFNYERTTGQRGDWLADMLRARLVWVDPVGAVEIAARLGVARDTVDKWRRRAVGFPAPRGEIGGRPAWEWLTVKRWYVERQT